MGEPPSHPLPCLLIDGICPAIAVMVDHTKCGHFLISHGKHTAGKRKVALWPRVCLTDQELAVLAERGTAIAHCPLSNFFFADVLLRVKHCLALGVKVPSLLSVCCTHSDCSRIPLLCFPSPKPGSYGTACLFHVTSCSWGGGGGQRMQHCIAEWPQT